MSFIVNPIERVTVIINNETHNEQNMDFQVFAISDRKFDMEFNDSHENDSTKSYSHFS